MMLSLVKVSRKKNYNCTMMLIIPTTQKSTRSTQSLYYTNHVLLTRSSCLSSSCANHATYIFQLTSNLPVNLELRTLNLLVRGCAICDDVGFCCSNVFLIHPPSCELQVDTIARRREERVFVIQHRTRELT